MTLDELTPIVSMRPGKEYTKEELRVARTAFMEKLGCSNPEIGPEEVKAPVLPKDVFEESVEEAAISNAFPDIEPEPVSVEAPIEPAADFAPTMILPEIDEAAEEAPIEETPVAAEEAKTAGEQPQAEAIEAPAEVEVPLESEEFILKSDSRLARFLYRLYAYLLLPVLALEALSLLIASVGTAVAVSNAPYIVIHVICAAVYTMFVTLSWHQFYNRTKLGLLLNRSLIGVCIIRGFLMVFSGTDILWGVIFISLSVLFLVYFIGYDSMFIIPSPKKQRAR